MGCCGSKDSKGIPEVKEINEGKGDKDGKEIAVPSGDPKVLKEGALTIWENEWKGMHAVLNDDSTLVWYSSHEKMDRKGCVALKQFAPFLCVGKLTDTITGRPTLPAEGKSEWIICVGTGLSDTDIKHWYLCANEEDFHAWMGEIIKTLPPPPPRKRKRKPKPEGGADTSSGLDDKSIPPADGQPKKKRRRKRTPGQAPGAPPTDGAPPASQAPPGGTYPQGNDGPPRPPGLPPPPQPGYGYQGGYAPPVPGYGPPGYGPPGYGPPGHGPPGYGPPGHGPPGYGGVAGYGYNQGCSNDLATGLLLGQAMGGGGGYDDDYYYYDDDSDEYEYYDDPSPFPSGLGLFNM